MIKRSFRFGLLVGLLGGLALALVKAFGRDEEPPAVPAAPGGANRPAPWPRLEGDPAVPARPQERLIADPDAPAAPVPDPEPVHQPVAMAPPPAEPVAAADEPTAKASKRASKAAATKPAKGTPKKAAQPAAKKPTKKRAAPPRAWVEPSGDVCPTSHPVKAKLASNIFHVPGGLSYGRTRPDRCYRDEATAEADGLRPAKR
ncbi:MAG: hypothetical protein ACO1PW_07645 [Actinomycetota bacterium]